MTQSYLKNIVIISGTNDEIKDAVTSICANYVEITSENLQLEIPRLRRHLHAANIVESTSIMWSPLDFLKFIAEWDFFETVPNIVLCLKLFLTICTSVASCERSFSKLKLIKNYLRSTMSQERVTDLALLSIENSIAQTLDYDLLIDEFAKMKTRQVPL